MALARQITLKSNFGDDVVFNSAYIKVKSLMGNKKSMRIDVEIHKAAEGVVIDYRNYSFAPNLDGKNFIAQAYEYLKTLPEFVGASDC